MSQMKGSFSRSLLSAFAIFVLAIIAYGQESKLGKVDFPTSGSGKAQAHFLRGLAALHSFWFEEALEEFQQSTRIEPDFMMGYWGEAMAYNHPLWSEQDTEAARKVIAKIKDIEKLTQREQGYLNAVKLLYGEGDKLARDKAYSAAMEKLYRAYPDDLEAACFYSLSLLGTVRPEEPGFLRQVRAGAIAFDVYQKNPNHPGAAHYIIHSFDDPEHAILALPAARRYAEIAPEAAHARHMPAHIFLQLGMWPEAALSNESAWAVSDAWVKRKNLSISLRDYHSLHWLLYVYLQQGRYSKAEELLGLMQKTMAESTSDNKLRPNYYANNFANMAASFVVETERWDAAAKLFPYEEKGGRQAGADSPATEHAGHGATAKPADPNAMTVRASNVSRILPLFVRAAAASVKSPSDAEKELAEIQSIRKGQPSAQNASNARGQKITEIRELEVAAMISASKGSFIEAIELMKKATAIEESMSPPSGPPVLIKPSHELLGEILLRANRPKEAAQQFATALLRQPNRARSLLGAARAAAQSGDAKSAAEIYSALLRQWQQADPQLPELREAQDYLKQANSR
jgi:tetratricopeptide (TPR) repeat protein